MFYDATLVGVTVFAATGDWGSSSGFTDGKALVWYPPSDPYVTACGGTTISNVSGSSFTETTWADTGGGISDVFPLPSWQQGIGVPPSANDNHTGRGIPDVAGNADPASGYLITLNGEQSAIGGTSAVSPLYAGLIALINSVRTRPVGYLNPKLYSYGKIPALKVFRDINDGVSNASNGAPGYKSGPGWDACTGWGSIDGDALLRALGPMIPCLGGRPIEPCIGGKPVIPCTGVRIFACTSGKPILHCVSGRPHIVTDSKPTSKPEIKQKPVR